MGEGTHLYGDRAPHNLQYVVLVASANLTQERVLTGTANQITITDGGAGAAVTLSIPSALTIPGTLDSSYTNTVAAGDSLIDVHIIQGDDDALTGTLRGAYITASNGDEVATGTIRGVEIKARAGYPGETGADVNVLEGFSISSDAKTYDVTTHRGGEIILDGGAGTSTLAVVLRLANNFQASRATTSYGLQIYRDSFDYTADIQLSSGGLIGGASGHLKIDSAGDVIISGTSTPSLTLQSTDASDPTLTFKTTNTANQIDVYLDESAATDTLRVVGKTAAQDTQFLIQAIDGERARILLYSGGANYSVLMHGAGDDLSLINTVSNKDLFLQVNDGGVNKRITFEGVTGDLVIYSDAGSTEKARIAGATGNFTGANFFVPDGGTFGISGNELLTFNAAGTAVFSGCNVGIAVTPWMRTVIEGAASTLALTSRANDAILSVSGAGGFGELVFGINANAPYNAFLQTKHASDDTTTYTIAINPLGGRTSFGLHSAGGVVHIDQSSATAAIPVLVLDQADISEEFIKFFGSAAAGVLTQSIVDEGDQASETLEGWLKVEVEDIGDQITDQAYFIPIYTLAA